MEAPGYFLNKNVDIFFTIGARPNLKPVFFRFNYDKSNVKKPITLSLTFVEKIRFICFTKMVEVPGYLFNKNNNISFTA
jgi:hypothetical protein